VVPARRISSRTLSPFTVGKCGILGILAADSSWLKGSASRVGSPIQTLSFRHTARPGFVRAKLRIEVAVNVTKPIHIQRTTFWPPISTPGAPSVLARYGRSYTSKCTMRARHSPRRTICARGNCRYANNCSLDLRLCLQDFRQRLSPRRNHCANKSNFSDLTPSFRALHAVRPLCVSAIRIRPEHSAERLRTSRPHVSE
jgi:hypothetical protein